MTGRRSRDRARSFAPGRWVRMPGISRVPSCRRLTGIYFIRYHAAPGAPHRGPPCPSDPSSASSQSKPTIEGAGVKLRRAFGFGDTTRVRSVPAARRFPQRPSRRLPAPAFPWHPHRGIETITYVLAGTVEHGDSLGNRGTLGAGDVQWMTAGSGILHQEMPQGDAQGRMHGFQLWANLPSSLKMTAPRYQDIKAADIPEIIDDDGTRVRVVCGEFWGKRGPVEGVAADPRYLDVSVPPGKRKTLAGRDDAARLRLRVRGLRHVPRRVGAVRRADREGDRRRARSLRPRADRQPLARAVRPRRRGHGAGRRGGHPLPAGLGQADRGAGRLVRPDRDEHAGRAAAGGQPSCATARSSSSRLFRRRTRRHHAGCACGARRSMPRCGS